MSRDEGIEDPGFERFERFLDEWSRRDFLRRVGVGAAWIAFSTGALELLEACGGGSNQNTQGVNPVKGGKLIEGTISDIATFNTLNSGDTASTQMITLCFDGLLSITDKGDNIPMLAQALPTISSDALTYTFKLRPNLKWSDGQPLTADDVAFTYGLMFRPDTKDFVSRYRADLEGFLESVTATDPQTVVFKFSKVQASFLDSHCRRGILPKHILGNVALKALNTHDFMSAPTVASGVFKFVKWDKGQQVVLARNTNYWAGQSYLDQYIYKVVTDAVVLAQQLKTGELDVGQPDASQFDNLKTQTNLTALSHVNPGFVYYQFNLGAGTTGSQLFGDKNVRKALHTALDRPSMAKAAYFGQAVAADSVLPPTTWAYNPNVTPKYSYDKAKAEQILDAAGWTKGPDGIRAKGGQKLTFELNTNSGNKVRENLITIMQQQWHDIGVDAKPRPIAFQTLVTQIRATHTFQIILIGIANGDTDPDETTLFTTKGIGSGGLNGMQYSNPQIDQLMADALKTPDRAKRKPLYAQIQNILADDLPAPILFYPNYLWGINNRVKNFKVGPYNTYQGRPWMKDVFVTDGK
ncbi:MAG TPA: ABC transporter substrate-binding protein [Candidatus Dormibacteraeota bacterium]|nr:ABC transporter substrate-binding protein [Candidatus Dormibacteraeota bacterium]